MHISLMKYFNTAGQLYSRMLAPVREEAGLTQGEMDILLFLANNPGYDTASDIVALRRLAKSNVSVGVRSLERKGLLCRCTDEKDRRIEHLMLTPAAGAVVKTGQEAQEAFGAVSVQGLSSQEREELERLLGRIHENMNGALNELD